MADRLVRSGAEAALLGHRQSRPDWNGDSRKGDNLYTSSLVAIDVDTGKPRWHFQFTPHDVHDWDANQIPVLVDTQIGGRPRALVVTANRNGFYYALDRKTGEFVFGTPYAKQTWAKGLDERGRPIEIPGMEPSEKGTLVYPSLQGSTNWASPSYSPATDMLYVPVREMGSVYYKTGVEYKPGTYYTGGSEKRLDEESWGAVRALDVKTGKQAWDFKLPTPTWAGVMATAGGLVFSGSNEGNFYALDAKSGKPLWQFQTGGAIRSGPMSFLAGDKQYVAVAGGHVPVRVEQVHERPGAQLPGREAADRHQERRQCKTAKSGRHIERVFGGVDGVDDVQPPAVLGEDAVDRTVARREQRYLAPAPG